MIQKLDMCQNWFSRMVKEFSFQENVRLSS